MEQLICREDKLINLQEILLAIQDINSCCEEISSCCTVLEAGDIIRTLMVTDASGKHRVYITDDGSEPVEVPFVYATPIETWLNTIKMKQIFLNGNDLFEMYLDGVVVFRRVLELDLPQHTDTINIRDFIDANNPDDLEVIEITNNLIQPAIISGDLCGLEVTFTNSVGAEIQGLSSGGDALTINSVCKMKLLNYGWIRGAGGDGGDGAGFNIGSIPSSVGVWEGRVSYDDGGPYISGQISPLWCNIPTCGIHAYYNRFWGSPGPTSGSTSGAWVLSGSAGGQEYWDINNRTINHAPIWGDQGPCHYNTSGFWCKAGLYIAVSVAIYVTGGTAGNGGAGIGFRQDRDEGWSAGTNGTYSGPSSGFTLTPYTKNINEGVNINLPDSGDLVGEDGGHGGTWATAGTASELGTNAGLPGGRAIVGFANLTLDSETGTVNGAIV